MSAETLRVASGGRRAFPESARCVRVSQRPDRRGRSGRNAVSRVLTILRALAPGYPVVLAVVLALAGCGGGGGGVRPDAPASEGPQPPKPSDVCIPTHSGVCRTPEDFDSIATPLADDYSGEENFKNQWGLDDIGAHWAYAHLEALMGEDAKPGSGVTIGFIDTGIDQDHSMFAGKTVTEEFLLGATDETIAGFDPDGYSHGTAVASIALGRPTTLANAPQGIAWAADVAMFAFPLGSGDGVYSPISLTGLANRDSVWSALFTHVLGKDIDILNLSIGFEGIIDGYSTQDLRDNFGNAIRAMAQAGAPEKIILVWAAGNAHGDDCTVSPSVPECVNGTVNAASVDVLSGLVARIAELRGHTVAVVALKDGPSGPTIADFSNRCGIAADYCIAAPGGVVRFAYFGGQGRGTSAGNGTSYAAPMVAGGLAIMKQLFRDQLSNTALVERLLATADDTGRFANRSVYGRGLVDLEAATTPVGVLDVPIGNRAAGPGTALQQTGILPGAAFGDGLGRSFAGREIAALDALGAPFWFDLGDFVAPAAAPSTSARLRDLMAPIPDSWRASAGGSGFEPGGVRTRRRAPSDWWRLGLVEASAGAGGGHLGLAGRALGLTVTDRHILSATAFATGGEFDPAPAAGATLSLRPTGIPFGFHSGWVGERETLLGSSADGAFGSLAADAVFAGIRADAELGGWRMSANAEIGTVDAAARDGLFTDVSPLTTSAFALHASRPLAGDGTLHLSIVQPLRVEHGRATLAVPVGRTKDGEVVRSRVSATLAPSGRQIDVSAQWHRPIPVGALRLGAVVTHQPGHRATEGLELTLLSGWRWTF